MSLYNYGFPGANDGVGTEMWIGCVATFRTTANENHTWPAGWTQVADREGPAHGDGGRPHISVYYNVIDGGSGESSPISVSLSGGIDYSWIMMRISGVHASTAPEAGTSATGDSSTQDPPDFNPPGWGTEKTLWVPWDCRESGPGSATAPSGYSNSQSQGNGTDQSACCCGTKEGETANDNPGTFVNVGGRFTCFNSAIRPEGDAFPQFVSSAGGSGNGSSVSVTLPA